MKNYALAFCFFLCLFSNSVSCERNDIHNMMYETFKNAAMCFRILNGTHQIGCSTTTSGSNGVIHYVTTTADIDWLVNKSVAGPYIVVIPPTFFTNDVMIRPVDAEPVRGPLLTLNGTDVARARPFYLYMPNILDSGYLLTDVMMRLAGAQQVSGVLLTINGTDNARARPPHMSPDETCPNGRSSLAGSCDPDHPWNPSGQALLQVDWPIPLFVTRDSLVVQNIYDCFTRFNIPLDDSQLSRPLCSLQMKSHMYAAVDTPTCLRRNSLTSSFSPISYCDPMGDQNIIHHLFPRNRYKTAPDGSVVLVTARLDTAAMFDDMAPGAMSTVTGIVTLLTTARLLGQLLPQYKDTYKKNVVFALLSGEAQDYIGSSRVVYDMKRGKFPSEELPIRPEHLDQVIDLHQLDAGKRLHCHCYKSGPAQMTIESLVKSCQQFGVTVEGSCSAVTGPLPPASLHSFLKANRSLPGVILTNHADQYTNSYYSGLLDDGVNLAYSYANGSDVAPASVQTSLAAAAHGLALTLAQMVDPGVVWPVNMTVKTTAGLVDELLHCYLESRQCELFTQVIGGLVDGVGPLPLYVGVNRSNNRLTLITLLTLAQLTGTPLNLTADQCAILCDATNTTDYYSCYWLGVTKGTCVATRIIRTPAVSPAFIIDNYNWTSGEYSSWTESVWADMGLRMFLRPPFSQELYTLISGLVVLFLSFASVYWVNQNADNLFNPLGSSQAGRDTTMLLEQVEPTPQYGTCERC